MSVYDARPLETLPTPMPLDRDLLDRLIADLGIDIRRASIREMNHLVNVIEVEFGMRFVRMEFGIPGLPVSPVAVDAEAEALRKRQVGHIYAPFDGVPELKREIARFVKLFMDIDVPPSCCVPTVGAMQGCFVSLTLAAHMHDDRKTALFLTPGFPVNRLQLRLIGLAQAKIDFYDHRGDKLIHAIEERVKQGDVSSILWSSPNNPSWIILDESELAGIGRICDEYGVLAIEDLAYFGMDTREDVLMPGQPPYQPTVMRYTDRGVCIISSSKMFSYAGQRIAMTVISQKLFESDCPGLVTTHGSANVGHAFLHGGLYPITASVPESPQYGLLALLRAANAGDRSLFAPAAEYSRRAAIMKPLFLENGFRLVYDNDLGQPIADGFYFTLAYPGFEHGADLIRELLHYGVSAITLETTGSCRTEGLRACVSMVADDQYDELERRLQAFRGDHPG